ncbi:MAG: 16S rRNA (cytidine(1402)-2'-O)-methyltransferase [Myxococcota bacterium]
MSTLYIVATPLGNLEDLTPRAQRVLGEVDVLYAEDTRRTRSLLQHFGIQRGLESLHEHNERERSARVLAHLESGKSVALVSDAGTPVVSDPGDHVVAEAKAAGFTVSPVVGPSAWAAAVSVAGFPAIGTLFLGFVPHKGRARNEALERVWTHPGPVVLFESPHRIAKTLDSLAAEQAERRGCVAREITKLHEEIRDGTLAELAQWAAKGLKGELTVVLGPWHLATPDSDREVDIALERCMAAGLSVRDGAAAVAAILERPRREVYARALEFWDKGRR